MDLLQKAINYEKCGSWAVWDENNEKSVDVIRKCERLHAKVVVVALNISKELEESWSNFRGGKHDRKLKELLNKSSAKGAYMTDLIKSYNEPDSFKVSKRIKDSEFLEAHLDDFKDEMQTVGANKDTIFLLFGSQVRDVFEKHLRQDYPNYVSCIHYSSYSITDEEWLVCNIARIDKEFKDQIQFQEGGMSNEEYIKDLLQLEI
jgi:hypothetical protein